MKKLLLLSAAIALILVSCKDSPPQEKTVLSNHTPFYRSPLVLNGKVKSFKMRTYWAKEEDGKVIKGDIITRVERDSLNYMNDFNLELNEDGLITRSEYITYNGEINHYEFEIMDGRIIGGKYFVRGENRTYFKDEYDDSGKLVKISAYRNGADTLIRTSDFTYLENGNRNEVYYYNYKGELTRKDKFIWKDPDRISEFQRYNGKDELVYSMKIEYDESGKFISSTFDFPDVRHTKYDFRDKEFDETGNIVSAISYKDDTLFCIQDRLIEYYQE